MVNNKDIGKSNSCSLPVKPFLKWAGGKRWLVFNHSEIFPKIFNRYIEPFLGSGAVFFHLQPKRALLGDSNRDLINTYLALQEDWSLVFRYLRDHHRLHSEEHYYEVRASNPRSLASKAARFIYLNRTCWNGLYRVNLQGIFNVPKGTKKTVLFNDDKFDLVAQTLLAANLYTCDFEVLLDRAEEGDLVFVDPPYTVRHNLNAFVKYNEKLFSWSDQERLSKALARAQDRGAYIVSTNAFHESVKKLYENKFGLWELSRTSLISSKVESRKKFEELLITTETNRE